MTLDELRDALAKATEGSLGLDKAILAALGYTWRGMGYWFKDDSHMLKGPTSVTRSIDAAVTLVPSGFHWSLDDRSSGGFASAWIVKPGSRTREVLVRARTSALAICLARVEYELQRAATPDAEGTGR